ncbi:hypothetical protein [Bacteroides clarus]
MKNKRTLRESQASTSQEPSRHFVRADRPPHGSRPRTSQEPGRHLTGVKQAPHENKKALLGNIFDY